MTHLSDTVKKLLQELSDQFDHAQALPDMAISLLDSAIEDGLFPEDIALRNIAAMVKEPGFPQNKKEKIEALLKRIYETREAA